MEINNIFQGPHGRAEAFFDMRDYIYFLTKGNDFSFAQLPADDKTAILFEALKEHGFISNDTQIEHFRVIFGIPLHRSKIPFKPIKWEKNQRLFRFFIYSLFPEETLFGDGLFGIPCLFTNKLGKPLHIPGSDKKRLEQSSDFDALNTILTNFNK